jgi:DNA polymerase-3 subunit epsilon
VAHNAPFDVEFLHAELGRLGRALPALPVIDTLALARRLMPRQRSHSLATLTAALGGEPPTHRALADVYALRLVFASLAERLSALAITTLGDTLRYIRGFGASTSEPDIPPLIASALRERRLLRIVYASVSSQQPTERIIRPLETVCERGVLYLRGYCFLRDDLRTFAITKILQMELEG